jgi:ABC-type nitrate/sulfonate/bicarbonate transport system substrate-binding protein
MSKNSARLVLSGLAVIVLLAACATPTPQVQQVEVTRVVESTVVVRETQINTVVETQVVEVEVPAEVTKLRVAYQTQLDFGDLPSVMAEEKLADMGYSVISTVYAEGNLAIAALAEGQADISIGNVGAYWNAAKQGAPILTVMAQSRNGWSLASTVDIAECADLEGKRYAIHAEGTSSAAMGDAYFAETCPDMTLGERLIIAGSENRAAALVAGQIDATPLELADVVRLDLANPGQFHVLANFGQDLPRLMTAAIFVDADFAAENPQAVRDYIKALLEVHREIKADPSLLEDAASHWLLIDAEQLPALVQAHVERDFWQVNGGDLSDDAIAYSLQFNNVTDVEPAQVVDASFLADVLTEIGEQ